MKKAISIGLIVLGLLFFGTSLVVDREIAIGQGKIKKGEGALGFLDTVSLVNPQAFVAERIVTAGGKRQIAKGRDDIAFYRGVSWILKIGGVLLVIYGGYCIYRKK